MTDWPELLCPGCLGDLDDSEPGARSCRSCGARYPDTGGVPDLRLAPDAAPPPRPTDAATLRRALAALDDGLGFKPALEALLLELDADSADALQLLLKESRGAWLPLLRTTGGHALFLGNAFSGTLTPLAGSGIHVTVVERNTDRLRFALHRGATVAPGHTRVVAAGDAARLPFRDGAFGLVVQEDGAPGPETGRGYGFEELKRVCSGEVLLTADNRLGYKRSIGLRGVYHVPGPLQYLRGVLRPPRKERTLAGYRRLFRGGFEATRAFALYPHTRDFTHIVGLDADRPQLTIGPKERKNVLKLAAHAVGLFPVLTPSFAVVGARREHRATPARIERMLAALAERLGQPVPELDILVATRSNTGLAHTFLRDANEEDPTGRWTLHLPLSPQKQVLLSKHHRFLSLVGQTFAGVAVPAPLFEGELEGMWLTCERRLPGITAPHTTGERAPTRRMFREASRDMARLVVEASAPFTADRFEELVADRFRIVRDHAAVESTVRHIDRMLAEARERLVGRSFPLTLYHGDLRSKHIQVRPDGAVVGYLDWGASEECFLPYIDLLHLVAHQRKQEEGCSPAFTWRMVRERDLLRDHEREALDDYARRIGLDEEVRSAIEAMYPVLVAGMAELNWDYSRPRWIHEQFGV